MDKRLGAAAFMALTVAMGGRAAAAPEGACKLAPVAELPVRFEHNRPLIEAKINGRPAIFLVDTGAANSLLFSDKAEGLGMHLTSENRTRFYGVGGGQDAYNAIARDFEMAGAKVKDFRFFAIPSRLGSPETGILGRDFLGHWDIEFDLASHTLRLLEAKGCGDRSLAYWADRSNVAPMRHDEPTAPFLVSLTINGKRVVATLDSGATTTVITTDAANQVGLRDAQSVGAVDYSRGIGSKLVGTRTAIFNKLDIGGEQISNAKIQVANLFASNVEQHTGSFLAHHVDVGDEPSMLLGADFLRSHRVLLASSQHRMYFTYNGGPIFQVVGDPAKTAAPPTPAPAPDPAPPPGSGGT